jgi:glycosyltransferase involved in cell wall biosynthesis
MPRSSGCEPSVSERVLGAGAVTTVRDQRTIRVLSFPDTHRNPYFRLFYAALAPYGVAVTYTDRPEDVLGSNGEARFDVLHLHWSIETNWRRGRTRRERIDCAWRWGRFLRAVRAAGVRLVWTAHETAPPEGGAWLDVVGYALCGMHCDLCICHSTLSRDLARRRCLVPRRRTVTLPIGTYAGVVPPAGPRALTNERFGLTPRSRLLVMFGDLRPRKGVEVAIEAAALLGEPYELVVAGDAPGIALRPYVESLRARFANTGNVRVTFRRLDDQELADLVGAADCVLLPYLDILASSALSLTLALGRAVVASDLPYFREVLSLEPDAGVLAKPGDPQALARGVREFFERPVDLRHAAAGRLAGRLAWDNVIAPVGAWFLANTGAGERERRQVTRRRRWGAHLLRSGRV